MGFITTQTSSGGDIVVTGVSDFYCIFADPDEETKSSIQICGDPNFHAYMQVLLVDGELTHLAREYMPSLRTAVTNANTAPNAMVTWQPLNPNASGTIACTITAQTFE
mgnify:CR=1 FL=1